MATTNISNLHLDVLLQILVKITCIRTLLRCTAVCKSWNYLVKHAEFITEHRLRANSSRYLLFTCAISKLDELYQSKIRYDNQLLDECYKLEFPPITKCNPVLATCNGLVCFSDIHDRSNVYLFNPAIRKFKTLPKYVHGNYEVGLVFGFGFHENDYLVVKIAYTEAESVVEVYSLNSNCWKIVSDSAPGSSLIEDDLAFVDGRVCWISYQGDDHHCGIVSLNLANGIVQEVVLIWDEDEYYEMQQASFHIVTLGCHSLAIFVMIGESISCCKCTEILVCDSNLNKILTVGLENRSCGLPLGFRNNGEALFRKTSSSWGMVSYNLETREEKDVELLEWIDFVEPFAETLVLLDHEDARGTL